MPSSQVFILARTASGRPSLQHLLSADSFDATPCGLDVSLWSRAYTPEPIPQIMCKKCLRKVER